MAANKPPPGHFNILYFASAASFTRKPSENFPAPVPIKELFDFLEGKYPGIKKSVLSCCALTVNLEYVDVEDAAGMVIKEGDEVGIIPPERLESSAKAERRTKSKGQGDVNAAEDLYTFRSQRNQNGELYCIEHVLLKSWAVLCHGIYQRCFQSRAWNVVQSDSKSAHMP